MSLGFVGFLGLSFVPNRRFRCAFRVHCAYEHDQHSESFSHLMHSKGSMQLNVKADTNANCSSCQTFRQAARFCFPVTPGFLAILARRVGRDDRQL